MSAITNTRIESELEVKTYLQNLRYALDNGAKLEFQVRRRVDDDRDEKFTNLYTINTLFPDENPVGALKRELRNLCVEEHRICFRIRRSRRVFHGYEISQE